MLVANLVRMSDAKGGWKAPDTGLWPKHLHAATVVGRMASAHKAVELGYGMHAGGTGYGTLAILAAIIGDAAAASRMPIPLWARGQGVDMSHCGAGARRESSASGRSALSPVLRWCAGSPT